MTQLTYQPSQDTYHTAFRIMRLNQSCWSQEPLHFDALRILDFFLLFPFFISEIRVQRKHTSYKKLGKKYSDARPFGHLPEKRTLLNKMNVIHLSAIETLSKAGIVDAKVWTSEKAIVQNADIPSPLQERINATNIDQSDLIEFLGVLASDYPLLGKDGLKDRSALMEYRYDSV
ncbi:hypothetical protein PsW64_02403 [Pseudovibrio sp. W64]|uniref:ABC-three component system middle component 5 n=1 Tax=Pseudovibrio sp. W64 TaxID=1735583 RepID=UPI0007AED543|nr:ABC-three component system middle component 5 [Pseudovibrio sp. W64]KZK81814.1 hypothetical protein PsW64_02403 [Pseudovibrio sp. W64]